MTRACDTETVGGATATVFIVAKTPTRLAALSADITTLAVDAIVNAANSSLLGGGGVDGAIHRAGGKSIVEACRAIVAAQGPCHPGQAVVTHGGLLPANLIIHTVGPVWTDDDADGHDQTLASCYHRCLDLAANHEVRTIAFPNISTGVFRFPKPRAADVAIGAVLTWLDANPDRSIASIQFVCFDDENLALYEERLRG